MDECGDAALHTFLIGFIKVKRSEKNRQYTVRAFPHDLRFLLMPATSTSRFRNR